MRILDIFKRKRYGIIEVYIDKSGEYRWRLKASNGRIVAESGEGYESSNDCEKGLKSARHNINTKRMFYRT